MSPIIKSVICIVCSVFFLVINTIILFLKPEFIFAKNDDENYNVFYQKWIGTIVYMSTLMIALFCIYFAINLKLFLSYSLLIIECLLLVIYALCKYKCVTVCGDDIIVERLFRKKLNTKVSKIQLVTYIPNAKLIVKINKNTTFDVSFNSENFHKFFKTLLKNDVKFKTGHIPNDENNVYLTKFNISIKFPKSMFREYYQSHSYFRNSKYLFSARSLENHEYIEAYYKESNKDLTEFTELVKNDLALNEFKVIKEQKEVIDIYNFIVIKSIYKVDQNKGRIALIYQLDNKYLVIYADYLLKDELDFYAKLKCAIHKPLYEDGKSRLVRV
ncbi:MAG: hypothetical protein ACI4XR_04610 [Bacilli bacterium]